MFEGRCFSESRVCSVYDSFSFCHYILVSEAPQHLKRSARTVLEEPRWGAWYSFIFPAMSRKSFSTWHIGGKQPFSALYITVFFFGPFVRGHAGLWWQLRSLNVSHSEPVPYETWYSHICPSRAPETFEVGSVPMCVSACVRGIVYVPLPPYTHADTCIWYEKVIRSCIACVGRIFVNIHHFIFWHTCITILNSKCSFINWLK